MFVKMISTLVVSYKVKGVTLLLPETTLGNNYILLIYAITLFLNRASNY